MRDLAWTKAMAKAAAGLVLSCDPVWWGSNFRKIYTSTSKGITALKGTAIFSFLKNLLPRYFCTLLSIFHYKLQAIYCRPLNLVGASGAYTSFYQSQKTRMVSINSIGNCKPNPSDSSFSATYQLNTLKVIRRSLMITEIVLLTLKPNYILNI